MRPAARWLDRVLPDRGLDGDTGRHAVETRRDLASVLDAGGVAVSDDDDRAAAPEVLGVLGAPLAASRAAGVAGCDYPGIFGCVDVALAFDDINAAPCLGRCDHRWQSVWDEATPFMAPWPVRPLAGF